MMKRFLAALLALMLVMGTLPASLAIGGNPTIACNHPATKWIYVQTATDCRHYGVQAEVCTTCGLWMGPTRDARGPHSWGAWAVTQEATCRQTGKQQRSCALCNLVEEQTVPKGGHKAGAWTTVREATCAVKGLQESKCLVCGTKITRETALLPHSVQDWTVTAAPTCVKPGSRTGTCAACGTAVTEKLEAAGHSWDEGSNVHAPKCEASGYKDSTCTVCGTKQRVTLPATGHAWGEWTVTIEPDGANRGKREHRCTVCNKYISEYFYEEGTLMEGDRGDEVAGLNAMLEDLGYNNEKDSDTFTRKTKAGVSTFQKAEGLKQSGVADPATRLLINLNWQIKWKVPELIEREWPVFFDKNRPGNRVLVDWRFTRPPHIRLTYGPWISNGNRTHTRRNLTLGTSETEECKMHQTPLSNDRTLFVCYLCGYKYVRIGRIIIPLEDGVQYLSNGDGTHTVVDVAANVIKQPKLLIEDCRFVPIGNFACNETGPYDVVCKDCGYQKQVDAAFLIAQGYTIGHAWTPDANGDVVCENCGKLRHLALDWDAHGAPCRSDGTAEVTCHNCGAKVLSEDAWADTMTHDFDDNVTEYCYATIRRCKRCGREIEENKEGGKCSFTTRLLTTPEEIADAGYDPAQVCRVEYVADKCAVCGRPADFSEPGPFALAHRYVDAGGVLTCSVCGRTSTCEQEGHIEGRVNCFDQASLEASPYNVKHAAWGPQLCYVELTTACTVCGQVTANTGFFVRSPHTYVMKDGVQTCIYCGKVNPCSHEMVNGRCALCGMRQVCVDGNHTPVTWACDKARLKDPGAYPDGDVVLFTVCAFCNVLLDVSVEGHQLQPFSTQQHRCGLCGLIEPHSFENGVCTVCGWKQ